MMKAFGAPGFEQMRAEKKKTRLSPEERRKQIKKVEVSGDYAYLEAESERKGVLDVAGFEKTADGWKVAPCAAGSAAAIASCRRGAPALEGSTGGRRQEAATLTTIAPRLDGDAKCGWSTASGRWAFASGTRAS